MIIELKNRLYLVWNKKCAKTRLRPVYFKARFNKDISEVEFKPVGNLFNSYAYTIAELESMLKTLREINKEIKGE